MIALLLVAVLVLVLLNAFFVAAEFALVRSRKAHLQTDADKGVRGASTAVAMMDDLSRYLSAAQVGITLTEQVPKIYAIQKAKNVARVVARPLLIFSKVFNPFIALLNGASNGILR